MYDHSILKDKIVYQFDAASEDKVTAVSKDHGAELYLQRVCIIISHDNHMIHTYHI